MKLVQSLSSSYPYRLQCPLLPAYESSLPKTSPSLVSLSKLINPKLYRRFEFLEIPFIQKPVTTTTTICQPPMQQMFPILASRLKQLEHYATNVTQTNAC